MRKESKILSATVPAGPKDPMNDDHWDDQVTDQVLALKELVTELLANQKKPRKKKVE